MSIKNKLKDIVNNCLLCGVHLNKKIDKIAYRIDKNKGFKEHNTVIICKDCHDIFINSNKYGGDDIKTIYNIFLNMQNIKNYFNKFGKKYINMFYMKIYTLRMKSKKGSDI
jgi:hypothetical protein